MDLSCKYATKLCYLQAKWFGIGFFCCKASLKVPNVIMLVLGAVFITVVACWLFNLMLLSVVFCSRK